MPMLQFSEERVVRIPHVSDAATHAGREVATGWTEDHDAAAGHVFAAVVADAFDHGMRTAVADGEPLGGAAADECFAARRAVQRDVADDDVVFGHKARFGGRIDDDAAAGKALADVIVRVADEFQRDAAGQERAEALAGRAGELEVDRAVGQAILAPASWRSRG